MATVTKTLLTGEDLLRMPDDGKDYELVRGELVELSPPGGGHGVRQSRIAHVLEEFLEQTGLGTVATESGFYVRRDPDTVRGPDVLFIGRDRLDPELEIEGYYEIVPDLVVEVVSPGDRHSEVAEKVDEYLSAGVKLVWVVDPRRQTVTIYPGPRTLRESDALTAEEVLPGFAVPVWRFFRRKQ